MQCLCICYVMCVLIVELSLAGLSNGQGTITKGDNSANTEFEKIPLPDSNCTSDNTACWGDIISLEAIKALHKQIDDDESGNIDVSESQEFFVDELQNTDGFERQTIFHGKDDKISVEDLWNAWKQSNVYNWTVDDVVEWVITSVDLPQYAGLFKKKMINGSLLPRVAVNCHHYISKELGIKNPVHKHKLSIKAMDVVLFGPTRKNHSLLKDIVLVTSVTLALGGCGFAIRQNKKSRDQMRKMMRDLDALQKAEDALMGMNEKLQKAEKEQTVVVKEKSDIEEKYRAEIIRAKLEAERLKKERQGSDLEELSRLELAEEELIQVRAALKQAEKELELRWAWGAPSDLQQWLQFTFELEQQHFMAKQQAAQRQFGLARDACEKIRRKRTGVLGTLRMAQGNSIDDIDQRIVQARMALEEIRHDIQERQHRWQTVELLCGFSIRINPGLTQLENMLYRDGAPMTIEETDEDFSPHYNIATVMLFNQKSNGCARTTPLAGVAPSIGDLKKRHVGSTSSLVRTQSSQAFINIASNKRESQESVIKSPATVSSFIKHSLPLSFQLEHSPVSSDSTEILPSGSPSPSNEEYLVPQSKSMSGVSLVQNGSRIPCLDLANTAIQAESNLYARRVSEGNLRACLLSKEPGTKASVGSAREPGTEAIVESSTEPGTDAGVGSSNQDVDSLSEAEPQNSKGNKKDKKKHKLIPKFMRKTE